MPTYRKGNAYDGYGRIGGEAAMLGISSEGKGLYSREHY